MAGKIPACLNEITWRGRGPELSCFLPHVKRMYVYVIDRYT